MAGEVSRKSTITGFIWRLSERMGAQIVNFVVTIILARLLEPTDYGVIAMVNVFIAIADVFVSSGFGTALIQKKDADNKDFSTVFFFQIGFSIVMYLVVFFTAPLITKFYGSSYSLLTPILRVLGLRLIITGVNNVQQAYVSKHLMFKKFFFATLIGTIISAIVSIFLAYKGIGAWALVVQYLTNTVIDTIILWFTVKWRPNFVFSFKRLKGLFSYGWKLLLSGLLDTAYNNLRSMIIGKIYSSADLAYYNKAKQFPNLIVQNINTSIDSVLLPTMSSVQDRKAALKSMTRRAMKTSTYVISPLLMGLAACGKAIISILLTDKWLPSYPFMVIFCITYCFTPVHTANLNAIKALGRSDLFLKLEIFKKIIGLTAIIITMKISVMAMAYSLLVTNVLAQIINSWPNKKLMNYSYLEQLKDILPGIGLAGLMGICVYCVNLLNLNMWLTLVIQVPLGALIYVSASALFKLESFTYCLNMIKPVLLKLKNKVVKKV